MFPRFSKIIPVLSFRVIQAARSKQMFVSNRKLATNVNTFVQNRSYSVRSSSENMTTTYEEVKNATQNNEILIIDVREPDEIREHGKIPNSVNIPLGDVTKVLSSMPEQEFEQIYKRTKPTEDSPIIFYCMIGKRSGMAQQNAVNLGYKQVKNYLGSWTEWASKTKKS